MNQRPQGGSGGSGGISQTDQLKLNARLCGRRYRIDGVTYGGGRAMNVLIAQAGNNISIDATVHSVRRPE